MPPKNDNIWVESQRCASSREPARLRGEVRKTKEIKQHPAARGSEQWRRYVNRVSCTSAFIIHTHFIRISAVKTIKIALVHVMWWSLPLLLVCSRSFMIPMKFLCCSAQSNTKKPLFSGVCVPASKHQQQVLFRDNRVNMTQGRRWKQEVVAAASVTTWRNWEQK